MYKPSLIYNKNRFRSTAPNPSTPTVPNQPSPNQSPFSPMPKHEEQYYIVGNTSAGEESDSNEVEVELNRIYFYSEVDRTSILKLNRAIRNLDNHITARSIELENNPVDIIIHINSYGGSLTDAFSTVDYIKNTVNNVCSIIDGTAASAATIISIVADKRVIYKNSLMLVHQLSSGIWGKYSEITDEKANCDLMMDMIRKIYKEHTKIPMYKLDEILKHDLWFDSATCLKYGLVDEII